ncbi:MAG: hypothetical protein K6E75_10600 [Lachnospiraceae bacterium]|nr:hypothetical protein [Lachnospiraceae bacterium]
MNENTGSERNKAKDDHIEIMQRREHSRREREIQRQEKRLIKEANKKLIYAPKKTRRSLGLLYIDPEGVMHFSDGRWLKIYRVKGNCSNLPDSAGKIRGRCILTHRIKAGAEDIYLTLTQEGNTYELVRRAFAEDEKCLEEMELKNMDMEETVNTICGKMYPDKSITDDRTPFSFGDFMKKRGDLETVLFPSVTDAYDRCGIGNSFGISMFVMQYPDRCDSSVIRAMKEEGVDDMVISIGINKVSVEERALLIRNLAERYALPLSDDQVEPFINASMKVAVFGSDEERVGRIGSKAERCFLKSGFMIAPGFGDQKESIYSLLSLGITQQGSFRNMTDKAIKEFFRREYGRYDTD